MTLMQIARVHAYNNAFLLTLVAKAVVFSMIFLTSLALGEWLADGSYVASLGLFCVFFISVEMILNARKALLVWYLASVMGIVGAGTFLVYHTHNAQAETGIISAKSILK